MKGAVKTVSYAIWQEVIGMFIIADMKSTIVGHIIRSRYLDATAGHYQRMVERLEASEQLTEWIREGVLLRHHYPYRESESSAVVIAHFDHHGVHLSSRLFAVHYAWLEKLPEQFALSYNIDHISRRNTQLYRLLQLLVEHQSRWIESGEAQDLRQYPYKQVVGDYSQRWGGYIDVTVISRLISGKRVELRFGNQGTERVILLRELFPRRWEQLGERIRHLMEDRERIWTDEALAEELAQLDEPISRRYVAHVRNRYGLSPGRGRRLKRKPGTPPICWGVPGHSMQSSLIRCRHDRESMSFQQRMESSILAPVTTCGNGCWNTSMGARTASGCGQSFSCAPTFFVLRSPTITRPSRV